MCIRGCINAVGFTSSAISIREKRNGHTTTTCRRGLVLSKRSMSKPSVGRHGDPIPACLPASSNRSASPNNISLSNVSGRCVNPTWMPPCPNRPSANGSAAFCPNSSSLSPYLESLPTTIWPNAVCGPWSLPARSVADHAVPRAVRPGWAWPASLAPGSLKVSILSTNASLYFPPKLL